MLSVACYTERNQGLPAAAQSRKGVEARSTLLCLAQFLGPNKKVGNRVIFKGWQGAYGALREGCGARVSTVETVNVPTNRQADWTSANPEDLADWLRNKY